jgi:hypothetical protein
MNSQANYLVYLCYGNEGIFYECAYSLLSLSRLYKPDELRNTEIWIYTDKPEWFQQLKGCLLPLNFRKIDESVLRQWKGSINFVHRVKIEVLKDFTWNRNGNILYLDTDTVFLQRMDAVFENIEAGKLYMHVCEGVVSDRGNPILEKLDKYLRTHAPLSVNGKAIYDLPMWNAGVLGFSTKHRYLLDDVLTFTDAEYPKFPKHVVEQFAFSVFFQQAGQIHSAAPWLIHYWNLKEARLLFAAFFEKYKGAGWGELAERSSEIQVPVLMQEKINFFENRSVIDKLRKKKWTPAL